MIKCREEGGTANIQEQFGFDEPLSCLEKVAAQGGLNFGFFGGEGRGCGGVVVMCPKFYLKILMEIHFSLSTGLNILLVVLYIYRE